MPRRILVILIAGIVLAMGLSISASAANSSKAHGRHHVVLDAPDKVFVDYDHCTSGGMPAKCVSPAFELTNYSRVTVSCDVNAKDRYGNAVLFSDTIPPGQSRAHGFTFPYMGLSVVLTLSCNGLEMPGQTRHIREINV